MNLDTQKNPLLEQKNLGLKNKRFRNKRVPNKKYRPRGWPKPIIEEDKKKKSNKEFCRKNDEFNFE